MLRKIIVAISILINIGGLIGLFTLPEDIPVAMQRMGAVARWFDRETLLITLFALSSTGLVWVTVQPIVLKWWERRKTPPLKLDFPNGINGEAKYGPNKRSQIFAPKDGAERPITRVVYSVSVENTTLSTIKNVTIHVHEVFNPIGYFVEAPLATQGGASSVDIQPGFTEHFVVGFRNFEGMNGESVAITSSQDVASIRGEIPDRSAFRLKTAVGHIDFLKNDGSKIILGVYGENVPHRRYLFEVNAKNEFSLIFKGEVNQNEV